MSWFVSFIHKELEVAFPLLVFLARSSTDAFKKENNLMNAAIVAVVLYLFSLCCNCVAVQWFEVYLQGLIQGQGFQPFCLHLTWLSPANLLGLYPLKELVELISFYSLTSFLNVYFLQEQNSAGIMF